MASGQPDNLQRAADTASGENGQEAALNHTEGEVWDEEQLEKAMKTLKEMHIQVRDTSHLNYEYELI